MKKNILLVLVVGLLFVGCKDKKQVAELIVTEQDRYIIKGSLENYDATKIYLNYGVPGFVKHSDSATVVNGKFEFRGSVDYPVPASLFTKELSSTPGMQTPIEFYLENTDINIEGTFDNPIIVGGKSQEHFVNFKDYMEASDDKMMSIMMNAATADASKKEDTREKMLRALQENYYKKLEYIMNNPDSPVSLNEMVILIQTIPVGKVYKGYKNMQPELLDNEVGKSLGEQFKIMMKSAVGAQALDFVQNDVNGNPVTFSEFSKGKYVIVDFWASWCKPCRMEIPNLMAAYKKYGSKNFDILSVSLDDNESAWKKAIKDDGVTWTQISDLKGDENEVAQLWGISAVPTTVIVNPEGKIIARNLWGGALDEELTKIFN